jgi:flagellar basal body rod protein FlgG
MLVRALGNALSGIASGLRRQQVVSHNVANLLTEDFRPLRARQSEVQAGGSRVEVERAASPEPVDLAQQFVEQSLAGLQTRASLRVMDTALDLLGELTRRKP